MFREYLTASIVVFGFTGTWLAGFHHPWIHETEALLFTGIAVWMIIFLVGGVKEGQEEDKIMSSKNGSKPKKVKPKVIKIEDIKIEEIGPEGSPGISS